jgi:hypothetical protein
LPNWCIAGPLAPGDSYDAAVDLAVPLDFAGEYDLLVVSDGVNTLDDRQRSNNRLTAPVNIELAPYADLAVTSTTAPETLIDDPATIEVAWTVRNQGT